MTKGHTGKAVRVDDRLMVLGVVLGAAALGLVAAALVAARRTRPRLSVIRLASGLSLSCSMLSIWLRFH
jgi:allophanate hydrolase subunit 1